ncbi:MAG: hypothetical protein M1834_007281 [Cirrosporium novae-zelandiae]|nr:MAG: hypothetical protein M1834_007281 [Cirrosporium novae-zelandiae]
MSAINIQIQDIRSLLKNLNLAADNFQVDIRQESSRLEAIEAAKKLVSALEKPEDVIFKHTYCTGQVFASRLAVELGIFRILDADGEKTSKQLAEMTNADQALIVRIMRVLIPLDFVGEMGPETYYPRPLTKTLANPLMEGTTKFIYETMNVFAKEIEYFKSNGFKNPTDPNNGPFQFAAGVNIGIFEWLDAHPDVFKSFHDYLEIDRGSRPSWVDWFPVQQQLLNGFTGSDKDVLLVDIGGSRGHDLATFRARFKTIPGRLILQDQPHVIDAIEALDEKIERQKHDFFTPEPIEGARAYYMKFILHDWSDEYSIPILRNIATAMRKGYSKLIIEEFVLPDEKCPELSAMWDLIVMNFISGMERSETQWKHLLESAGLKVMKVWRPPGDGQGIIEAELQD